MRTFDYFTLAGDGPFSIEVGPDENTQIPAEIVDARYHETPSHMGGGGWREPGQPPSYWFSPEHNSWMVLTPLRPRTLEDLIAERRVLDEQPATD